MYEHFLIDKHNMFVTCPNMTREEIEKIQNLAGATTVALKYSIIIEVTDGTLHIFKEIVG